MTFGQGHFDVGFNRSCHKSTGRATGPGKNLLTTLAKSWHGKCRDEPSTAIVGVLRGADDVGPRGHAPHQFWNNAQNANGPATLNEPGPILILTAARYRRNSPGNQD